MDKWVLLPQQQWLWVDRIRIPHSREYTASREEDGAAGGLASAVGEGRGYSALGSQCAVTLTLAAISCDWCLGLKRRVESHYHSLGQVRVRGSQHQR